MPKKKQQKREEAQARQQAYNELTYHEKLKKAGDKEKAKLLAKGPGRECSHGIKLEVVCLACTPLVRRNRCKDCGNPWWHDTSNAWVCSTCARTHGKSTSEEMSYKEERAKHDNDSDFRSSREWQEYNGTGDIREM